MRGGGGLLEHLVTTTTPFFAKLLLELFIQPVNCSQKIEGWRGPAVAPPNQDQPILCHFPGPSLSSCNFLATFSKPVQQLAGAARNQDQPFLCHFLQSRIFVTFLKLSILFTSPRSKSQPRPSHLLSPHPRASLLVTF